MTLNPIIQRTTLFSMLIWILWYSFVITSQIIGNIFQHCNPAAWTFYKNKLKQTRHKFAFSIRNWTSHTSAANQKAELHSVLSYNIKSNLLKMSKEIKQNVEGGGGWGFSWKGWEDMRDLTQTPLWDFQCGAVRSPANATSLSVGVWVCVGVCPALKHKGHTDWKETSLYI